jgi:negative regulator of flagellin synthesis FlgM
MVDSIGQARASALNSIKLREAGKSQAPASVNPDGGPSEAAETQSPAARMAAQGAPVDAARIAEIKAAIANGDYPVDPEKIAEKMIDLDMPGKEG